MVNSVIAAWVRWGQEQGLWEQVNLRRMLLAKLTEEELQRKHAASDHVPFRKGCPICIQSQGRQRSHWRASHTGLYSASFDIAGPFTPGRSFDPTASGRDKGTGYRYFLACAFSVPVFSEAADAGSSEVPPKEEGPTTPKVPKARDEREVSATPEEPPDSDLDEDLAALFDGVEALALEPDPEGLGGSKQYVFGLVLNDQRVRTSPL